MILFLIFLTESILGKFTSFVTVHKVVLLQDFSLETAKICCGAGEVIVRELVHFLFGAVLRKCPMQQAVTQVLNLRFTL